MRLPVAAKMALQRAGTTGGNAGSPRPVGGLSVMRNATSTGGAWSIRSGLTLSKFDCTTRPRSMVIGLPERRAQPVERRALHLVLGAARIDDLAADVADHPDMVELDVA